MVALTFPDGARREYPPKTTGFDIAKSISPSLAKRIATARPMRFAAPVTSATRPFSP